MRELSPEPWRVKVVERIRSISREERERALERAGSTSPTSSSASTASPRSSAASA